MSRTRVGYQPGIAARPRWAGREPARYVRDHVHRAGRAVVDIDPAVGAHGRHNQVGDRLAGQEVQIGCQRSGRSVRVNCQVARPLGLRDGDVQHHRADSDAGAPPRPVTCTAMALPPGAGPAAPTPIRVSSKRAGDSAGKTSPLGGCDGLTRCRGRNHHRKYQSQEGADGQACGRDLSVTSRNAHLSPHRCAAPELALQRKQRRVAIGRTPIQAAPATSTVSG